MLSMKEEEKVKKREHFLQGPLASHHSTFLEPYLAVFLGSPAPHPSVRQGLLWYMIRIFTHYS